MDRIVIEVDDNLAKAWRIASEKKRKEIGNKINVSLAQEFLKDPAGEYLDFLKTFRNDVAQKGLTQDELDEILKDE